MSNHLPEQIKTILVNNGVDVDGGSFHSWRCFDKERYPEPCTCTDEVVAEIMEVVTVALRACEQRVEGSNQGFADMASFELGKRDERKRSAALIADAYAAGVQAARDAVDAVSEWGGPELSRILAAIDALKGEAMTDHLPECPCTALGVPSCICDDSEECGPQCRHNCICDRLRACEARSYALGIEVGKHDGWLAGHAAGVRAARAIVWDAKCDCTRGTGEEHSPYCLTVSMLAAIDAIKEMP